MGLTRLSITGLSISVLAAFFGFGLNLTAQAHENKPTQQQQFATSPLQVTGQLPAPLAGVSDIKFNELFKMPVGPRGMEPSEKLLSLDQKPVRIVGYMAKQETPTPGMFIVSPLPVNMGDEDDKFADDMPANSIFVHLDNPDALISYIPGLIHLTGVLSLGNAHEPDGRISYVRIKLDPVSSSLLLPSHQASK
ncbi:MAG: hypothetical protein ACAH10_06135 [Methylophilaceae bacterium]